MNINNVPKWNSEMATGRIPIAKTTQQKEVA